MPDDVLVLDGVCKGFARGDEWLHVLQDVSLAVCTGEIVAVVGTRDQGKTTLLRIAAGTLPPEQGSVRLGERDLAGLKDSQLARVLRSEIGLATRSGPAVRVRVRDYAGLHLTTGVRLKRRERRRRVTQALEMTGVTECAAMRWRDLSNWQRLRVELAQGVVTRPRLLLVDDLLDGFGLGKKQAAMDMLRAFATDVHCGVLMACSDHTSALSSDRIWRLDGGRLKLMADLSDPDVIPLHKDVERGRVWYAES
ncbi:MAG: ATP-binding cassette domain-containing protein [Solirubrobacteraceae bacterium]